MRTKTSSRFKNQTLGFLRQLRRNLLVILANSILFSIASYGLTNQAAFAQSSPFDWSYPLRITQSQEQTSEPELAADRSGLLHLFWSPYTTTASQSLYYSQWDGIAWSNPIDIFNLRQIFGPSAAVDSKGTIHLVWSDGTTIYYSQAPVDKAISARNWADATPIANGNAHPQILVDEKDKLYLVYPRLSSAGPAMLTSEDSGFTWSTESIISFTNTPDTSADYTRAAIASDGTLHVVWTEYQLPVGWPPVGLYYSHSNDSGLTWSRPVLITSGNYNQINVATFGDRTVHIAWNGAAGTGGRYHRWSQDGGNSWSSTQVVVPEGLGGSEGPPQLAIDSLGTLHLITTFDQRVWYSYFQPTSGQRWSELIYVPTGDETGIPPVGQPIDPTTQRLIEHPALAINGGNKLHLVFWDVRSNQQFIQYWYSSKQTSAGSLELLPFVSPTPPAQSTQKNETVVPTASITTPTPAFDEDAGVGIPTANPGWPTFAAVMPVVILLSVIILFRMAKLNKK